MRNGKSILCLTSWGLFSTCCAIGWTLAVLTASAQEQHAALAPDLDSVVTLSRGGMSQDVIEAFLVNSGNSYSLTAAEVDYLHKQGVSDAVIDFLLKTDESVGSAQTASGNIGEIPPSVAGPTTNSPIPRPSADDAAKLANFKAQLSPYGNWSDVPGYGMAWQPSSMDAGWRPYFDGGSWTYSDQGWYWRTEYAWGDIPFHYGRWVLTPRGWFWVPGYEYAPSWVVWRYADRDGYIGWAPLPPGTVMVNGGWVYRGMRVALDFDFGLGPRDFMFVSHEGFWEHDFHRYELADGLLADIFHRSRFENHFWFDHDRSFNYGIDSTIVANLTHHKIHEAIVRDLRAEEESRNLDARRRDSLAMRDSGKRPNSMASLAAHDGNRTEDDPKAPARGARRGRGGRANNPATAEATPQNTRSGGTDTAAAEGGARGARRGRGGRANEPATKEPEVQSPRRGGTEIATSESETRGGRRGRGETPNNSAKELATPEKKPARGAREGEAPRGVREGEASRGTREVETGREGQPRKENDRGETQ